MNKSKKILKEITYEDLSTEPVNIHCFCNKCGERIVLPAKVWYKRGSICNRCYHRIHEEELK